MDPQQSERYFHGYILVPCCTEDCCHNQLQRLQAIPSSYNSSIPKDEAILPDQNEHQPTHASRHTSHGREGDCRLLFPAIYRQRPQTCGVSRHKIGAKRLPASSLLRGI